MSHACQGVNDFSFSKGHLNMNIDFILKVMIDYSFLPTIVCYLVILHPKNMTFYGPTVLSTYSAKGMV